MSLSLSYGIPPAQYQATYGNRVLLAPNEGPVTTQLPRNMALTRIVHIIALSIFVAVALKTTIFCWPAVVLGAAFAAWTGYKHLLTKDPMVEVFHRILGGQENFEKLPQIQLEQNQPLGNTIRNLIWEDLPTICKATTEDGRKIVIVKGLSHENVKPTLLFPGNCQTQKIFVFVEKLSPFDYPSRNAPEWFNYIAFIGYAHPFFSSHTFGEQLSWSRRSRGGVESCNEISLNASVTSSLANEFFVQLNPQ